MNEETFKLLYNNFDPKIVKKSQALECSLKQFISDFQDGTFQRNRKIQYENGEINLNLLLKKLLMEKVLDALDFIEHQYEYAHINEETYIRYKTNVLNFINFLEKKDKC